MASRTLQTGDDVEAALLFLAKEAGTTSEQYFMNRVAELCKKALTEADDKRFELAKKMLDDKNKGESISKLRELLGA